MCDIGEVYKILNFLTNDTLYTHQLPRAARECKPYLLRQYPELKNISLENVNTDNWKQILSELESAHGAVLDCEQIPRDGHDYRGPIEELLDMVGKDKVVVINA